MDDLGNLKLFPSMALCASIVQQKGILVEVQNSATNTPCLASSQRNEIDKKSHCWCGRTAMSLELSLGPRRLHFFGNLKYGLERMLGECLIIYLFLYGTYPPLCFR